MAKQSDAYQNRHAYIPPSVQKTMSQHMERSMPSHLKKYQQSSGVIPQRAEREMSQHLQKNLPSHLKKYADPYMQQHVVWGQGGGGGSQSAASRGTMPSGTPRSPRQSLHYSGTSQGSGQPPPQGQGGDSSSSDPYGFIMNPQNPPKAALFLPMNGSPKQKLLFIGVASMLFIILFSIVFNFLNSAGNAQKDRLIALGITQGEIARVAEEAGQDLEDRSLQNISSVARLSAVSSQQEIIEALALRGEEVSSSELGLEDPANDEKLAEGEQNGRYDQAYKELLVQQLEDYQLQLQAVYDDSTPAEQEIMVSANEQIELLLKKLNA